MTGSLVLINKAIFITFNLSIYCGIQKSRICVALRKKQFLRSKWNEEICPFHFSLILRTDITEFVFQSSSAWRPKKAPFGCPQCWFVCTLTRDSHPSDFFSFFFFLFPFKTKKLPQDFHKVEEETLPIRRKVTADWEKRTNCSSNKICEKFK